DNVPAPCRSTICSRADIVPCSMPHAPPCCNTTQYRLYQPSRGRHSTNSIAINPTEYNGACSDEYNAPADAHKKWTAHRQSLFIGLFCQLGRIIFRREARRRSAAQLAQEILLGLERPAGELAAVAMVADFVRSAMAAVAVNDPGMRAGRCGARQRSLNLQSKR